MEIEKSISFFIDQQFPDIYRQDGPELVQLVKDYYKFLESESNQSNYVSRRFFEYKDVDTTLKSMLIFFQKKYMADLPLKEEIVPFLTKNILDLYRRKGTPAGIETFFSIFFNEYDIEITYPAEKMLRVSDSKWRRGVYLQMFPNSNRFLSPKTETAYSYADLISRNIEGSSTGAKAAVSRINFILLSGSKTPIIYIDEVQGNFAKYDEIVSNINGELVSFGTVNGSLNNFTVDLDPSLVRTSGNQVGDIFNITADNGSGGKVVVTSVSNALRGQIEYEVLDGGYGYSVDNTSLLVSEQTLVIPNENLDFVLFETLRDDVGREGIVVGQNKSSIGVKMNPGEEFELARPIFAIERDPSTALPFQLITEKNVTSPGTLFPDGGNANTDVIASITNTTDIEVITDVIQPFAGVNINAPDYEAAAPMSGSASPVNLSTPLDQAFDIQTITIGKIEVFRNVLPGEGYANQVFARAVDNVIKPFNRRQQIIRFQTTGDAGIFNVGEIITEDSTGLQGEVKEIDTAKGLISVVPFSFDGFTGQNDIIRGNGDQFAVGGVEIDFESRPMGDNALIGTETEFAVGQIDTVNIINSGFGYIDGSRADITDDEGVVQASGFIEQQTQGISEGYWSSISSHLDGWVAEPRKDEHDILPTADLAMQVLRVAVGLSTSPAELELWAESTASDGFAYFDMNKDGNITSSDALVILRLSTGLTNNFSEADFERWNTIVAPSMKQQAWFKLYPNYYTWVPVLSYYTSGQRIQDSDYYQEYSYQIKSTLDKGLYEKALKQNVHLAGTKMFGDFSYKVELPSSTKARFTRFFNDDGRGSALDIANTDTLEASVTNFTVDTTFVTADHEPI